MIASTKTKIEWVKSANLLAVLTLPFSSFLFFYDLFNGRYLLTERDLGPYFIPPRFFWVDSLKNGDFPLWNPFQFSGHPFFANPQHAILYPLNCHFFLLPFDLAFNSIIILHFFLGGLFTYIFLKDLKVASTGSLISGLIFMLSGYLLSVHSLLNCLLSVIWTPLIIMFFRRAIANPGFKNEVLAAIFISISFFGGGVEVVYGNFFVLLLMAIFSAQLNPPSPPFSKGGLREPVSEAPKWAATVGHHYRNILYRFRSLSIVSILFLFLSAIQLIPFLELWIHSIRGKGISYPEATVWSFAPKDILLFFLPDAYGYFLDMKRYWVTQCWFKTLYTGGLPFILSLIFFLFPHRIPFSKRDCLVIPFCYCQRPNGARQSLMRLLRSFHSLAMTLLRSIEGGKESVTGFGKDRRFYLSLILLSLFLSLGQYNPLYSVIFKYVPFFNGIRYPVKFLYIFILVLSITAGLGFQRLTEFSGEGGTKRLKNLLILSSLASGLLLLCLILGHKQVEHFLKLRGVDFPDFNYLSVNLFHAKRFLFYLTLFFLLLRVGHEVKWKGWTKVLLIFFLTADLFGNMGFYGKEKTSDYFQKTKIVETISLDQGIFRVFSTGKTTSLDTPILVAGASPLDVLKEKHLPTLNLLYRLHDIWGIDVVRLKRVDDLYNGLTGVPSISATNLIDLYGVKYIISVTLIEKDPRFELIYVRLEGLQGKKEDLLKENTVKLYRRRNAFPRAWLVKDFRVLGAKEILLRLKSKEFHPNKEVLLEEEPRWKQEFGSLLLSLEQNKTGGYRGPPLQSIKHVGEPHRGLPEFISESNNRLRLRVKASENTFLVLSDTYFPGWKVYVDGNKGEIYRANYTFRAVPLNAGIHKIEFAYDPISFKLGAIVTFLAIMGCVGVGLVTRRRRAHKT